jgi:hypothetical protein
MTGNLRGWQQRVKSVSHPQISEKNIYFRASVEDKQEDADFRGDRVGIAMATSVRREGKARELCMVKGRGNVL